jgi:OmpA-OmpF porin, OOP family
MLKHFSLILKMHFLKTLLFYTLLVVISNNSIAQQKDSVVKKESTGSFKHMKVPGYVLPDADKDGVTDQFDKEQNTAKGCPVDSHGVSLDIDGDGVIDCKDKEPLTKRDCFPVDTLGIGKCIERSCCGQGIVDPIFYTDSCKLKKFQPLYFKGNTKNLNPDSRKLLGSIALQLNTNPECGITIIGYYKRGKDNSREMNAERIKVIIKYLVDHEGISESRLFQNFREGDNIEIIDLYPMKS